MRLDRANFGREAVKHLLVGLAALGAAMSSGGSARVALVDEAGRRFGYAAAVWKVRGLYPARDGEGHAAALSSAPPRVRQSRTPSGR